MGEKTTKAIITPNCANHAKGGRGEGFSSAAAFFFSCCAQQEVHCHTRNTTVGGRGDYLVFGVHCKAQEANKVFIKILL